MTREQAKDYMTSRPEHYLQPAKKKDTYICPICGNGSGKEGDGITRNPNSPTHYKCFVCGFYGDLIELIGQAERIENIGERFRRAYEIYGVTVDNEQQPAKPAHDTAQNKKARQQSNYDYTEYYRACHARSSQTDYFTFRGISKDTIDRFVLGYDPEWRPPQYPTAMATQRIIIPVEKGSYLARATRPDAKYQKQKIGHVEVFNKKALMDKTSAFIFVTEAEIDALSIIEAGGQAVALGSVNNKVKFIDACKATPPTVPLVLCLDNDDAGRNAQQQIKNELEKLGISFLEVNVSGDYNDPNEALQNERLSFTERIKNPMEVLTAEKEAKLQSYIEKNAVCNCLKAFMNGVKESANTPAIPTGFKEFDRVLDGGLYEGMYILGALSSIGKTSFCLQIADQIAQHCEDVLIFSLEMSKYELISKSLSRLTYLNCNGFVANAKTNRGITDGARYSHYSKAECALIKECLDEYTEFGKNLYIHEGVGNIGAEQIKEIVKEHISITKKTPIVLIDYLQILAPYDMRATDKQNTDKAVLELKRLSREYKIPVIAISSFNRDNYLSPVNMASFKESGAIEYSSDILLGLQFDGMDDLSLNENDKPAKKSEMLQKIENWKTANPRRVQLKILKNRNGATGASVLYDYYPMFNYFRESAANEFRPGKLEPCDGEVFEKTQRR